MNWSVRCAACKKCDEQHEKRHREIAELVAKIKKLDTHEDEDFATIALLRTPSTPLRAINLNSVADALSGTGDDEEEDQAQSVSKKERKTAKKLARAATRERKAIDAAEIARIGAFLHPRAQEDDVNRPDQDLEIKENLKFHAPTCNGKVARVTFMEDGNVPHAPPSTEDVDQILADLNISRAATGAQKMLVKELAAAIERDLVHHHDELRIFARNKAGFWRWANAKAYHNLLEHGQSWDARRDLQSDTSNSREATAMQNELEESSLNCADTSTIDDGSASESASAVSITSGATLPSLAGSHQTKASSQLNLCVHVSVEDGDERSTQDGFDTSLEAGVDDAEMKQKSVILQSEAHQISGQAAADARSKIKLVHNHGLHHFRTRIIPRYHHTEYAVDVYDDEDEDTEDAYMWQSDSD